MALVLHANWCTTICITCPILRKIIQFLRKIECIEFVCNKFVLILVQIDLIQIDNSNCIRSIWTKTNANLFHTNLIHSMSHKIGHVIQIVVHKFVHKQAPTKIPKNIDPLLSPGMREYVESVLRRKNWSPINPKYAKNTQNQY